MVVRIHCQDWPSLMSLRASHLGTFASELQAFSRIQFFLSLQSSSATCFLDFRRKLSLYSCLLGRRMTPMEHAVLFFILRQHYHRMQTFLVRVDSRLDFDESLTVLAGVRSLVKQEKVV